MDDKERLELLEYLQTARDLELGLVKTQEIRSVINTKIQQLEAEILKQHTFDESPYQPVNIIYVDNLMLSYIGMGIGLLYSIIGAWHEVLESTGLFERAFTFIVFCVVCCIFAAIGGVLGFIIALIINRSKSAKVNKGWENRLRTAQSRFNSECEAEKAQNKAKQADLKETVVILDEVHDYYRQILDNHYHNGPIYVKYQTLPAICQLYEYFDAKRFTRLGDAYNQYELEVRLDRIISDIGLALRQMDKIRENQLLLYEALLDLNETVDSLANKMGRMEATLDQVAIDSAITSVCAEHIANATTLLARVEYYKNRHNLPLDVHVLRAEMDMTKETIRGRTSHLL